MEGEEEEQQQEQEERGGGKEEGGGCAKGRRTEGRGSLVWAVA